MPRPPNKQTSSLHLIQLLLPEYDNLGKKFSARDYQKVKLELTAKYKGLTAYNRAPAEGTWRKRGSINRDSIIVYEVRAAKMDLQWWKKYRLQLERRFRQQELVIRIQKIRLV